tara:strand:- start:148 stop:609 length:462 start_codon:yes stop_codon:yes gene_type:complete
MVFNENEFIKRLHDLPEEIAMTHIFPKLSPNTLVWLNKDNYKQNHFIVQKMIPKGRHSQYPQGGHEAYIRDMVRKDNSFVFEQIINERQHKWLRMRKYLYSTYIFDTYLHFLAYFAFKSSAYKCEQIIKNIGLSELGEKWHKRSKVRNIKWSN